MPNRIIRESCRTSPTLDQLSDLAERMFWRLTTVADDHGRFDADPRVLLASCFPLRVGRISPSSVSKCLQELARAGIVTLYNVAGRDYGEFVTWTRHQRVRSTTSKFPAPDKASRTSADIGGHPLSNVPVFEGIESRVQESLIRKCPQTTADTEPDPGPSDPEDDPEPSDSEEISEVFQHYLDRSGKNPNAYKLTKSRRACIRARLRDYDPPALKAAIDACFASPFHQGQNDRDQVYNSLEKNILRSNEKVDWWLDQARQKAKGTSHA